MPGRYLPPSLVRDVETWLVSRRETPVHVSARNGSGFVCILVEENYEEVPSRLRFGH